MIISNEELGSLIDRIKEMPIAPSREYKYYLLLDLYNRLRLDLESLKALQEIE